MKRITLAAGVLNQTPLDWQHNRDHILEAIGAARLQNASVLCLPELCITGYGCEDAFHSVGVQQTALEVLHEIVPHTLGIVVSVGLPLLHRGALFNAACLIADGQIRGFVGKQNLAGEGLHYEPRWFKPWPNDVTVPIRIADREYPLGDLVFDCDGVRMGFEICEDAWVASRPGGQLAAEGADILLNPSASHFAFDKHRVRRRFVLEGSRAFHVAYVYANLLGNEAGRAIYDGDAMIASCGQMLATGPRFSMRDVHVTSATVDVDQIRVSRARASNFRAAIDSPRRQIAIPFALPTAPEEPPVECVPIAAGFWDRAESRKEEEFTRALALGLLDYLRKSYSRGFVVSLSGGADSAAVATLCSLMVRMATDELGVEGLRRKLAFIPALREAVDVATITERLLTCVYQATRNSSETTRSAAEQVARAVHASYLELQVDSLVQDYVTLIEAAVARPLSWEHDDLALQNIQARVRGPSVWMLANLGGALLLATSNRSEAAVGYATMDGDTCGGLSPIAGIDKAFLRQWLRWMEQHGPAGIGPLPALSAVNRQQPTAELRPQASKQTDEDDLMPYDLLDKIERAAIRDKQTPLDAFRTVRRCFPQYTDSQLGIWVERFFRLWCRNQWKRERYAPSFHLDDENLDPKTWCRFPILSGGFERELTELRAFLATR
jgi:NAD+ synthase (glutamine-hydrolysing)